MTRHRVEGRCAGLQRPGGEREARSGKRMTDEERGGQEPRTGQILKGTLAPRAASDSPDLFTSFTTQLPVEEPIVSTDEVIFPLTVSLDRLPPGTPKAKVILARGRAVSLFQTTGLCLSSRLWSCVPCAQIVVTVWKREVEAPEVRDQGYLRLLQTRSPGETFRGEQSAFKAQGGEESAERKCGSLEFGGQWRGATAKCPIPGEEED